MSSLGGLWPLVATDDRYPPINQYTNVLRYNVKGSTQSIARTADKCKICMIGIPIKYLIYNIHAIKITIGLIEWIVPMDLLLYMGNIKVTKRYNKIIIP